MLFYFVAAVSLSDSSTASGPPSLSEKAKKTERLIMHRTAGASAVSSEKLIEEAEDFPDFISSQFLHPYFHSIAILRSCQ